MYATQHTSNANAVVSLDHDGDFLAESLHGRAAGSHSHGPREVQTGMLIPRQIIEW
jgi:hypothetical protein